jgi:acyl-CoA synthetase (AMP-forming)/AMP-acid ligase II
LKAVKGFTNTDSNERLTHLQIKNYSTYFSTALIRDHGLREGDVVSICSPNSVWFPVAMFGIMRAGGISALSSPGYTEDEMVHVLKTVGCRFVMVSMSALEVVKRAAKKLEINEKRIFIMGGQTKGSKSMRDLLDVGRRYGEADQVKPSKLPAGKLNSEVCAVLCFSSGTIGLPKAVGHLLFLQVHSQGSFGLTGGKGHGITSKHHSTKSPADPDDIRRSSDDSGIASILPQ